VVDVQRWEKKCGAIDRNTLNLQLKFKLCHCILKEITNLTLMSYLCQHFCVQLLVLNFKMSNKHVFCQLNITHVYFFHCHISPMIKS